MPPIGLGLWLHGVKDVSWPITLGCLVVLEIAIALWVRLGFPGL